MVAKGEEVDFADGAFDCSISCECFEHNPNWEETFLNMHRMTRPGGFVVVSCAGKGRLEHGTRRTEPNESPGTQASGSDYYKNLKPNHLNKLDLRKLFERHLIIENRFSKDLYFVGEVKGSYKARQIEWEEGLLRKTIIDKTTRMHRTKPFAFRVMRSIKHAPLDFMSNLPDRLFQNFALPYQKMSLKIKSAIIGK